MLSVLMSGKVRKKEKRQNTMKKETMKNCTVKNSTTVAKLIQMY